MIDPLLIEEQIGQILREDIGFGDLTSTIMIDEDTTGVFDVNAREEIVVAGMAVAAAIFKRCEPGCTFEPKVNDGDLNVGIRQGNRGYGGDIDRHP